MCLFDSIDGVTFGFERLDGFQSVFVILPFDGFFGSECGLMNFGIGRAATDSAEYNPFNPHGVCGAEDCSHIMLATHVI
jgi:hypothetical protein